MARTIIQLLTTQNWVAEFENGDRYPVIAWAFYKESGITASSPGYGRPAAPQPISGLIVLPEDAGVFFADEIDGFLKYVYFLQN